MTNLPLPNGTRGAGCLAALAFSLAALFAATPARAQKLPSPAEPVDPQVVWNFDQVTQQARLTNPGTVSARLSRGYPRRLLDSGVAGSATLEVIVGPRGQVEQVSVVDASRREFTDVARDLARTMRFRPAKVQDIAVRSRFTVPVDFVLDPA
ncbi:energy transducer TonB [Longimicrobium sp.]|uniref:energy transducer TonB n=1 Tax=Longimicrobium sp. TaxID=2029185 RepID=UPI002C70FBF8|nr:energy transducer TonB [Longimicrobium sp.]HSU16340.1 energy transducer TonB [Longimicrobium sp.]